MARLIPTLIALVLLSAGEDGGGILAVSAREIPFFRSLLQFAGGFQPTCNGQVYSAASYQCLTLGSQQVLCPNGAPCACPTPAATQVGGASYGCYTPSQYHCTQQNLQQPTLVQGAGSNDAGVCAAGDNTPPPSSPPAPLLPPPTSNSPPPGIPATTPPPHPSSTPPPPAPSTQSCINQCAVGDCTCPSNGGEAVCACFSPTAGQYHCDGSKPMGSMLQQGAGANTAGSCAVSPSPPTPGPNTPPPSDNSPPPAPLIPPPTGDTPPPAPDTPPPNDNNPPPAPLLPPPSDDTPPPAPDTPPPNDINPPPAPLLPPPSGDTPPPAPDTPPPNDNNPPPAPLLPPPSGDTPPPAPDTPPPNDNNPPPAPLMPPPSGDTPPPGTPATNPPPPDSSALSPPPPSIQSSCTNGVRDGDVCTARSTFIYNKVYGPGCICGDTIGYSFNSQNPSKSFMDTYSTGNQVLGVTFTLTGIQQENGGVTVIVDGVIIGSSTGLDQNYGCGATCTTVEIQATPESLESLSAVYNYGGSNTVQVTQGGFRGYAAFTSGSITVRTVSTI